VNTLNNNNDDDDDNSVIIIINNNNNNNTTYKNYLLKGFNTDTHIYIHEHRFERRKQNKKRVYITQYY